MTAQRSVKAIIYTAVLAWTGILYIHHEAIKTPWLQHLSTVITVVLYAVIAFDLWLWKLPFLHDWFVKRPVIDGTWAVEIRSNWKHPETQAPIQPIEAYMVVRQTLSTLSMRLFTSESHSQLVGTEIVCSADAQYCVSGVYRNEPRSEVRERSAMHYGAVWLRIVTQPVKELTGHYWTDRGTGGSMEFAHRQRQKFQTFAAARQHYQRLPKSVGA